jgi:hypothetical protein
MKGDEGGESESDDEDAVNSDDERRGNRRAEVTSCLYVWAQATCDLDFACCVCTHPHMSMLIRGNMQMRSTRK